MSMISIMMILTITVLSIQFNVSGSDLAVGYRLDTYPTHVVVNSESLHDLNGATYTLVNDISKEKVIGKLDTYRKTIEPDVGTWYLILSYPDGDTFVTDPFTISTVLDKTIDLTYEVDKEADTVVFTYGDAVGTYRSIGETKILPPNTLTIGYGGDFCEFVAFKFDGGLEEVIEINTGSLQLDLWYNNGELFTTVTPGEGALPEPLLDNLYFKVRNGIYSNVLGTVYVDNTIGIPQAMIVDTNNPLYIKFVGYVPVDVKGTEKDMHISTSEVSRSVLFSDGQSYEKYEVDGLQTRIFRVDEDVYSHLDKILVRLREGISK